MNIQDLIKRKKSTSKCFNEEDSLKVVDPDGYTLQEDSLKVVDPDGYTLQFVKDAFNEAIDNDIAEIQGKIIAKVPVTYAGKRLTLQKARNKIAELRGLKK